MIHTRYGNELTANGSIIKTSSMTLNFMLDEDKSALLTPCLAGTTGRLYQAFQPKSSPKGPAGLDEINDDPQPLQTVPCADESNYFKSALW